MDTIAMENSKGGVGKMAGRDSSLVSCLLLTSSGLVVSGSWDDTLRVWDPATGECLRTLEEHTNSINCVIETKVGLLVSGSGDNTLRVWDLSKGIGQECVEVWLLKVAKSN